MSEKANKHILVIGGSSGIGLAICRQLVAQNFTVIAASRSSSDELESMKVRQIQLDVTKLEDELDVLPDAINGIVYCPGTINLRPFKALKIEEFQHDLDINFLGAVKVLQKTLKNLKKADGASVVLFSTVAVKVGLNFHSSIAAAKGAIEGLGKSLAAEWASSKIRVNMIAPSLTDTPLARQLLSTPEKQEASDKRHPIGRTGTAEDIANIASFLISDNSSWITGQVLGVDGGFSTLKPV